LEKLTVLHVVNKLPLHYGSRKLATLFTKALPAGQETPYFCWSVNFRSVFTCSPAGGTGPCPHPGESSTHSFLICYHQPVKEKRSN